MKYSNNLNLVEHMLIWVQNSTKAQIKNELEYSITKVNDLRSVFVRLFVSASSRCTPHVFHNQGSSQHCLKR